MKTLSVPSTRPGFAIDRLRDHHRAQVLEHLMTLTEADRRMRFGHGAVDAIDRYVAGLDFERELVLGAVEPHGALIGLAHVPVEADVAELGLSVLPQARRRGVGRELAIRARWEAERRGARAFRFHSTSSNDAMRRIAASLCMHVMLDGNDLLAECGLPQRLRTAA